MEKILIKSQLFQKKKCLIPTWRGFVTFLIILVFSIHFFSIKIVGFLNPNFPRKTDVLIVEGFLPDHALSELKELINNRNYRLILLTGSPLTKGSYLSEYQNQAEITSESLIKLGIRSDKIILIPSKEIIKDRTYSCALAIKNWVTENLEEPQQLNLCSYGCHGRRSWILYLKAFENSNIKIGIHTIPSIRYNPNNWWKSSIGVRTVLSEVIYYIYVRFIFNTRK